MSFDPEPQSMYTDVHMQTIREAYDTLSKLFDGFVIVTMLNSDDYKTEQVRCQHHGGLVQGKGLLREGLLILDQCSLNIDE